MSNISSVFQDVKIVILSSGGRCWGVHGNGGLGLERPKHFSLQPAWSDAGLWQQWDWALQNLVKIAPQVGNNFKAANAFVLSHRPTTLPATAAHCSTCRHVRVWGWDCLSHSAWPRVPLAEEGEMMSTKPFQEGREMLLVSCRHEIVHRRQKEYYWWIFNRDFGFYFLRISMKMFIENCEEV